MTSLTDRTFAAVLFDNDGTLIDSSQSVTRSWVTWAKEYDIDPVTLHGFHGMPSRAIVAAVAPHLSEVEQDAAQERIVALESADTEGVVALPGALEALRQLGERAAIVTSATQGLARARFAAGGLPVPRVVVTASEITRGKPDPQPYLRAAQRLGVAPQTCLVVEDAPSGVTAGHAAGCGTLAVVTTTSREELVELADLVVGSLADVDFVVGADGVRLVTT